MCAIIIVCLAWHTEIIRSSVKLLQLEMESFMAYIPVGLHIVVDITKHVVLVHTGGCAVRSHLVLSAMNTTRHNMLYSYVAHSHLHLY